MANKIISAHFLHCGIPKTGLVPIINIWELDPVLPAIFTQVVTNGVLTELTQGFYRYDFATYDPTKSYNFIIDGGATLPTNERYQVGVNESYAEDVSLNVADAVWDEPIASHLTVGSTGLTLSQIKFDTTNIIISQSAITLLIQTLLKYQVNRTRIDPIAMTLTIFDDDCLTPLTVFDLKDSLGNPSVLEVCERRPTTC